MVTGDRRTVTVEFLNSQDSYTEEDYKKDSDELEKDLEEKKDLEQEENGASLPSFY